MSAPSPHAGIRTRAKALGHPAPASPTLERTHFWNQWRIRRPSRMSAAVPTVSSLVTASIVAWSGAVAQPRLPSSKRTSPTTVGEGWRKSTVTASRMDWPVTIRGSEISGMQCRGQPRGEVRRRWRRRRQQTESVLGRDAAASLHQACAVRGVLAQTIHHGDEALARAEVHGRAREPEASRNGERATINDPKRGNAERNH